MGERSASLGGLTLAKARALLPLPLARFAYRLAYVGLRIGSLVLRPHTRGVKCMVCVGDELLLVRHSYGPRLWDLPGGFVRRNEAFAAAAQRELAEELSGGRGVAHTELGEMQRDFSGRHETIRGYRVDLPAKDVRRQGAELAELGWFRRDALPGRRSPIVDEILALEARFASS